MFIKIQDTYINTDHVSRMVIRNTYSNNSAKLLVYFSYPGTQGSAYPAEQVQVFEYGSLAEAEEDAERLARKHNNQNLIGY